MTFKLTTMIFYGFGLLTLAGNVIDAGDYNDIYSRGEIKISGASAANGVLQAQNVASDANISLSVVNIAGSAIIKGYGSGKLD